MEPNELIEGDFMYIEHLSYIKEEVYISSDESDFFNYDDCGIDPVHNKEDENEVECNYVVNDKTNYHKEDILDNEVVTANSGHLQINHLNSNASVFEVDTVSINDVRNTGETTSNEKKYNTFDSIREASSTYQNDPKRAKKRQIVHWKNMISVCCFRCNKVRRLLGVKQMECKMCKIPMQYRCNKCYSRYKSYISAYYHVKKTCTRTRDTAATILYCSACYYETTSKENLDNHVRIRHAIRECFDCGKKCESNLMKKHQLFECKFSIWKKSANGDVASDTKMKALNNYNAKILLEQYCKRCDKIIESYKHRGVKKCRICKTKLVYQCATCCKRYKLIISAYTHVRACNNPSQFQCNECDFRTTYKLSLTSHIERKHVLKECQECNAICENYKSLKCHELYECISNPRYKGDKETPKRKSNKKKRNKTLDKIRKAFKA